MLLTWDIINLTNMLCFKESSAFTGQNTFVTQWPTARHHVYCFPLPFEYIFFIAHDVQVHDFTHFHLSSCCVALLINCVVHLKHCISLKANLPKKNHIIKYSPKFLFCRVRVALVNVQNLWIFCKRSRKKMVTFSKKAGYRAGASIRAYSIFVWTDTVESIIYTCKGEHACVH